MGEPGGRAPPACRTGRGSPAIVVASCALRVWLVRGMPAPFVFVDELIYSELARSFADAGSFAVRGVPTSGYSILYPILLAPAYALFDALPSAYAAAKATTPSRCRSRPFPAWLITRRVAGRGLSLLAAAIAVAIPSMAYTATLVTENLFYPVALLFAWTLLRVLERPSWRRIAVLARGARRRVRDPLPGARLRRRDPARAVRPRAARGATPASCARFVPLLGGDRRARRCSSSQRSSRAGRSLSDLLGAYSVVGEGGYDVGHVLRFWLWHVEELTLYVAVVPVVALVVLLWRARRLPAARAGAPRRDGRAGRDVDARRRRVRLAVRAGPRPGPLPVLPRPAPRRRARSRGSTLGAPRPRVAARRRLGRRGRRSSSCSPTTRFIGEPAKSDTFGAAPALVGERAPARRLVPGHRRSSSRSRSSRCFALVPAAPRDRRPARPARRLRRPLAAGLVGAARRAPLGRGRAVPGDPRRPARLDRRPRALGRRVAVLWTGRADRFTVNQNEFFNRTVGSVYYTSEPTPGGLGETPVRVDADGIVQRRRTGGTGGRARTRSSTGR